MKIWCVEDDASIREIELYTLESTGFEGRGFENAGSFFKALQEEHPDLVILDIMLPDTDGTEVLKKLRSDPETESIPVIMASAKGAEYDKVRNLDEGADDYLAKPFGMMEMISRIKAVLRRSGKQEEKMIERDGICVKPASHTVTVDGRPLELTLKEYELLLMLISHPEIVYTREQILDRIWGIEYDGETRTVDVHIRTLRTKLGGKENHIATVRGVGYRYQEG
jgi:two-component system alkaline phosphatase synthesis response regulator PhoP